jgi:carbamoyl-phosphate synthase large subunit
VADALRGDFTFDDVAKITRIDPWFLAQVEDLVLTEIELPEQGIGSLDATRLRALKRKGFSDSRLAEILKVEESDIRKRRINLNVRPVFKRVDTCAAEFATSTAYLYSTYEEECEADPSDKPKIMILGGGPNRIGQGIEFDYCCVHAVMALKESGYETIMVNCNPETVSTDYDTSDRLYFESLTFEDVMEIIDLEKPQGVIVQYGGQTPLKLARDLEAAGAPIIGTSPDSIDLAEDRERFMQLVEDLGLTQPPNCTARNKEEAIRLGSKVGFPLIVRPSYVLGGRAMEVVHGEEDLAAYMDAAIQVSNDSPVLLDRFLDLAIEVDVDCICDGERVLIGGIMEHIEQAGVHSGDSGCSLPPFSLSDEVQKELKEQVVKLAKGLNVIGLMNTQFAIQGDVIYLLEVNPRASRTVPFVSKAIGVPLAKIAAKTMVGEKLADQGFVNQRVPEYYSVKEAVFPFIKFPGSDPILGPEMKSTGEVMGIGRSFGEAYAKAQLASGVVLPRQGVALLSIRERDKEGAVELARILVERGFEIVATHGTAQYLASTGVLCRRANKVREGRPHIVDMIKNGEIDLIVNTTEGKQAINESISIRAEAVRRGVTYYTTLGAAIATCTAIEHLDDGEVNRLQDLHNEVVV